MLIIVLLWSSWLIVSQERHLPSSAAPAVETEMVLHAVLSDMHRKNFTAVLDRFPPVLFNIKELGHSEFSEVTGRSLPNLKVQLKLNACFFLLQHSCLLWKPCPLLCFERKKHLYFILLVSWSHPLPSQQEISRPAAAEWRQIFWLPAGSQHDASPVLLIRLNAEWLYGSTLALSSQDGRSLAVLGWPFLGMLNPLPSALPALLC